MSQPEDHAAQADPATSETVSGIPADTSLEPAAADEGTEQISTPVSASTSATSSASPHLPKVRRTRFSVLWTTVIIAALVLILLLIFILENNNSVQIEFLGASGKLPLGVAMLFAAIAGVLLVAIPGYGRILQLRRAVRKAGNRTT